MCLMLKKKVSSLWERSIGSLSLSYTHNYKITASKTTSFFGYSSPQQIPGHKPSLQLMHV
ncbi:hypothetical protein HanRHA438_Chr16g0735961 [Helianthus annuus]|nr:hypothetical protein HanRHA438_Chr16g0735961 [Helianthus annuus]